MLRNSPKTPNVLVSDVIDLERTVAVIRARIRHWRAALAGVTSHLSEHHPSPEAVGALAERAKVRKVVLTHLLPGSDDPADVTRLRRGRRGLFSGEVAVAADLHRF